MKLTKQTALILAAAVLLTATYQFGTLNADPAAAPAKIAVVNVTQVLETSQKHKVWQEKMQKERSAMEREFQRYREEIEAVQANLRLRTPGSEDHLRLQQEFFEKKAVMEAKDEFYRNKVEAEMQRWTESLYKEMLAAVDTVAKRRGVDMVLADELLDFPAPSLRDFMLTLKTKKMLYFNPRFDLSEEVQRELDKTQ